MKAHPLLIVCVTAKAAGEKGIKDSMNEFMKLYNTWRSDRKNINTASPVYGPPEYGGRICNHCEISETGEKKYTYYTTYTIGPYPNKTRSDGATGSVYADAAQKCDLGDLQVSFWHTGASPSLRKYPFDHIA